MNEPESSTQPKPPSSRLPSYRAPAVVFEAALEAQAGSPLGGPLNQDPLSLTNEP